MTTSTTSRLSLRAGVAAVALLVSALVLPSSAAPDDTGEAGSPAPILAPSIGDEFPSPEGFTLAGVVASTQHTVARRAKMSLTIGPDNPILGVLQYGRWNDPIEDPTRFNAQKRVVWPFDPLPCDPGERIQYVLSDLTLMTAKPDGSVDTIGDLPPTRVNLLALGSVPATATIHLSMTRSSAGVVPWQVHVWSPGSTPECPGQTRFNRALVEGQADIRISDLVVDGVPVDLGPSCRTETPVDISMWGEPGYQALVGGTLGQYDGLARGTITPLVSPLYFQHEGRTIPDSTGIDIPPFIGCEAGGEDLSAIVTAMASGPNNPIRVQQGNPMKTPADPDNLLKCDSPGVCPLPAPIVPPMPPLPAGDMP